MADQSSSSSSSKPTVTEITSREQFHEVVRGDKPVAIDFWAVWCGPCRVISPIFAKLAEKNEGVGFYKVDIESVPDLARELQIRAMPTFRLYHKSDTAIDEVVGAIPMKLQALINKGSDLAKVNEKL